VQTGHPLGEIFRPGYQHDPVFLAQHQELLTRQQVQLFPRLAGDHYLIFSAHGNGCLHERPPGKAYFDFTLPKIRWGVNHFGEGKRKRVKSEG
jgi:hypothetical protein